MNSFMSWIGGKKALRDEIISRFPTDYKRYIEVFGGGGWVLFHKAPGNNFEVYNDRNPNLANLYRCVRDHPDELISELTYTLNSRTDFDYIRKVMKTPTEIPDVKRAAYFYQLIRYSYASGLDSYASQPHSMWNNFPLINNACARLQKVVIENKDLLLPMIVVTGLFGWMGRSDVEIDRDEIISGLTSEQIEEINEIDFETTGEETE